MMFSLVLLVAITLVTIMTAASIQFRSSRMPIVLNLKSYKQIGKVSNMTQSRSEHVSNIRTKPLMIQRVLGLVPGKRFEFSLDRWIALKESGLYRNLTAKTILKDNEVILEVSGVEMPCVTFAPEVSVGASLSNPNIAGGVLYRNKNFRGLGEEIEIKMAKKETIEVTSQDIQDLGVSSIFRWRDCSIGRSSNIELKYEKDTIIDTFGNFVLHSSKRFDKMIVGMSRFCAVLKSSMLAPNHFNWKHSLSIEPYICQLDTGPDMLCIMSGTKSRYDVENTKTGFTGSCWVDCGNCMPWSMSKSRDDDEVFSVFGGRISSPSIHILPITYNSSEVFPSSMGRMKFRGLVSKAFGSDLIPYFHLKSLANPSVVRCAMIDKENYHNTISTAITAKADMYLKPIANMVTAGLFTDVCVFKKESHEKMNCVATYGLSLRSHGIRIDIGTPVLSTNRPRIHIGLDDGE